MKKNGGMGFVVYTITSEVRIKARIYSPDYCDRASGLGQLGPISLLSSWHMCTEDVP